eukprot:TRINITY_DN1690_c0_g1_i3.p1 TRINITY_DN1690_c0_g1~~TRINITY_DN1690_c0_g1_i3.p1  ORF type:complete len:185 (+),score=7.22 TRINITY_DN1690_c0_g1_i3:131-685(+)
MTFKCPCSGCSFQSEIYSRYFRHLKLVHSPDSQLRIICNYRNCTIIVKGFSSLVQHLSSNHQRTATDSYHKPLQFRRLKCSYKHKGKLKYKVLAEGVEFYETCSLVEALIGFFTLLYSSNKPYSPTGVLLNILIDLFMFERVQTESYTKKTITQYEEIRSIHNQSQAAHLHLPEIFRHPQKRNR